MADRARTKPLDRQAARNADEPQHDANRRGNEVADSVATADDALESVQEHARLHGCLEGLASHERAALRGAFFDGNTYDDLAKRMSVPLGTMKSWIRRAMIKLKACLEQ